MLTSHNIEQDKQVFIDPDTTLPKTYFQLMQKVGATGKYQRNMLYVFLLIFFATGTILMSTSFIFMNDEYTCPSKGLLVTSCKKTICSLQTSSSQSEYFIPNKQGITSIATDYGPFICDDQFLLDMIKSAPYFGSLIGFVLASMFADNVGRKMIMVVALAVATFGSILMVFGFKLWMITVGVVLAGAGINIASALCFCFLGETVQDLKRQRYSILIQLSYTVGSMCLTGLYFTIGNWRINTIILQTIPVTLTLFIFIFYIEDTPLFLLKQSNSYALKALNRIGYINFGLKDILSQADIENVRTEQLATEKFNNMKVSPLDLMKFKSLRRTTICGCMLGFITLSMYYGPSLIIDKIGFNMFLSSFVIQLSQMVGYIPCYFYIDKVKRRTAGFYLFLTTVVCSLILVLFPKPEQCDICFESVMEIVVIFIFRFAIATEFIFFLVYIVELFPTRVVGVGVSAINGAGTIASTLCPIILGALQRIDFNFMMFFFILGVVGCSLTLLLDETHNKPIKTQIDEILYAKNKKKSEYIGSMESIKSQKTIGSIQKI